MVPAPFHDPRVRPGDEALAARIGAPYAIITAALHELAGENKAATMSWKFSRTSGWYVTYDRARKRLFYLFPQDGGFLLKIVFNEAGVEHIGASGLPADVTDRLRAARKYAEGTLLEFTPSEITAPVLTALLRIKVASVR